MVFGSRNQRPQQVPRLEQYANLVEQILTAIGYVPANIRLPTNEGYGWSFRRGSAIIEIYVQQQPDNTGIMQVLSPIMHLPQSGLLPLYRRLLELNEDIGLATVYRVLTQFESAGLVTRHHFEGGTAVFELNEGTHHDHIVCVDCGHVEEFSDEGIEERQQSIAKQLGFEITDHSLTLHGHCVRADCPNRPKRP